MGADREVEQPVILFDGVCNLCTGSVLFAIKRDPKELFRFASLQSEFGKSVLQKFNLSSAEMNSVLLLDRGTLYQRSSAALAIARKLNGGWPLLYGFKIIPAFLRDAIYNWIARNRYRWFGKTDACMIPTPELKSRFLD